MNEIKKVEKVNWHTNWSVVTNKYGSLLSYNLPVIHNIYASLQYQSYITTMLESKEYEIFVDVGAFVGLFSQIASHHCIYVCAYEAQPFFFGILLHNMQYYKNVDCEYKYVSCKGDRPLTDGNFMGLLTTDSNDREYNIEVVSLDDEFKPPKDMKMLIKMDIEGSELKALDGAKELIKSENVHWIIDNHPNRGVEIEDVKKYFKNRETIQKGFKVLIVK